MKKLLVILGGVFLGLIGLGALFIGFVAVTGPKLDASSKTYVEKNIPVILSTWSKDELQKRASAELLQVATPEKMDYLFSHLQNLGALKNYDGFKGESHTSLTTQNGWFVTADYISAATFQNGTATIKVRLIRKGGQWQILTFYVDSPLLVK